MIDSRIDGSVWAAEIKNGLPDLQTWPPLDFYFWDYIKKEVYSEESTTVENMKERIRQACTNINSDPLKGL